MKNIQQTDFPDVNCLEDSQMLYGWGPGSHQFPGLTSGSKGCSQGRVSWVSWLGKWLSWEIVWMLGFHLINGLCFPSGRIRCKARKIKYLACTTRKPWSSCHNNIVFFFLNSKCVRQFLTHNLTVHCSVVSSSLNSLLWVNNCIGNRTSLLRCWMLGLSPPAQHTHTHKLKRMPLTTSRNDSLGSAPAEC